MKAHAARRGPPPDVDEGDARGLAALLRRELRPTPGRLGDSVRIVVVVLAAVAIAETFRIPEIAVSAYIVLFLSGREAVTTVRTSLAAGIAVVLAIFATIAVFMLSLSEPALRIPLMAIMTFAAMFLSRVSPLGPVFFVAGFIIAYGLTSGDQVLGLALQPATIGNAPQFELPEIFFVPPEEALVRFLLWFSLAIVVPVVLVIAANLLTGRDPARLLRSALAGRLAAPRTEPATYRFSVAVRPPRTLPAALNGFGLWLGLMVALTIVNYGFPIAHSLATPGTAVPAVKVGERW